MARALIDLITSSDPALRDSAMDSVCANLSAAELVAESEALEEFRQRSDNLYERVRALFFLYAIHRYHLPRKSGVAAQGQIPFHGYEQLLKRRFTEAIAIFLEAQEKHGPSESISSALASAYHGLAFQTLADQVRKS